MLKKSFFAVLLGSSLLVGCNGGDETMGEDDNVIDDMGEDIKEGVNDVQDGVDDMGDDIQKGANDVKDGVNDVIEDTTPNTNNDNPIDSQNGAGQDINVKDSTTNNEDIIEDPKDVKDSDKIDE